MSAKATSRASTHENVAKAHRCACEGEARMLRSLDPHRCPVDQALEVVAGKWKPLILWRLHAGTLRFGELQRAVPGVTQRMLTLQLRELERDGLVERTAYAEVPPRVEYALTAPARKLMPVMEGMGAWLQKHHADLRDAAEGGRAAARPAPVAPGGDNVRVLRIRK